MNVPTAASQEAAEPQGGIPPAQSLPPEEEGACTDEEAFYAAQAESFADMRAHLQAWPRRRL